MSPWGEIVVVEESFIIPSQGWFWSTDAGMVNRLLYSDHPISRAKLVGAATDGGTACE